MSYRVKTESFEGPFDLLLYLVARQRVDIGAIAIADIVDQYLAEVTRLRNVDLSVASDFLLVASTLLEIKAESLIPREKDETDEEIADLAPSEAREMLVGRLLDYKKYKNVASMLEQRQREQALMHERPFGPDREFLDVMPDFLRGITVDGLGYLACSAYARREVMLLESEHIASKPIPVEIHVKALQKRLANRKHMRFSEMVDEKTPLPVVVVTFLALLELYKRSKVNIKQDTQFGDIEVDYIEGSDEDDSGDEVEHDARKGELK